MIWLHWEMVCEVRGDRTGSCILSQQIITKIPASVLQVNVFIAKFSVGYIMKVYNVIVVVGGVFLVGLIIPVTLIILLFFDSILLLNYGCYVISRPVVVAYWLLALGAMIGAN